MSYKTYGVTRELGGKIYSNSGFSSHEKALMNVYRRAFKDGEWSPPTLREKWWQIWRPAEHNEIEAHFAELEREEHTND